MRTRNKQAKDQSSNKRPKRGADTTDATNENAKTPNKAEKRKSARDTPTKGKKRTNIDLDMENDGSEEKEKRKRTDVNTYKYIEMFLFCSFCLNLFKSKLFFSFYLQSPTESLNSDSRPGSVIDDQENTSEPPEIPSVELDQKETDDKLTDPLSIAESNNENIAKDENPQPQTASNKELNSEPITTPEIDKETNFKLQLSSPDDSNNSLPDEKVVAITTTSSSETTVETKTTTTAISNESKPLESAELPPITTASVFVRKEQELISTIANIKKETNVIAAAPLVQTPTDYKTKDTALFIKKEPGEDSTENSNSNSNSNSNEPHDLKLAVDIKSENKSGLDLTDHESKFTDGQKVSFDSHVKFVQPPSESHLKYGSEPIKYNEPPKFSQELQSGLKYPSTMSDPLKYANEGIINYDVKPFMDQSNKYPEGNLKPYPDGECPPAIKGYAPDSIELKYSIVDGQQNKPLHMEQIKYENNESSIIKRPPYAMRSPYETSAIMKYNEAMQKHSGMHLAPVSSANVQDLKYPPAVDMKYRPPENLSKSQFSTDNIMKGNMYGGEYSSSAKYPPTESPIDASARSTPNQDSQSSNSNMQAQMQHNNSLPSPHSNQVHHLQPNALPMIMCQSGIQQHLGPLGSNHPSIMASNSPLTSTAMSSIISTPVHHMVSTTASSSAIQVQPLSLIGSNQSPIMPPTSSSLSHPALHRPHQDIPQSMHPSGPFSAGILPQHSSSNQSSSPAIHDRCDPKRRMENLHRSSPGIMQIQPGAAMLNHAGIPIHLPPNMSASGIPLLPAHHPAHLGPPLLSSTIPGANSALPLIGGPSINSTPSAISEGRRTPTSLPPSSVAQAIVQNTSSAFSRTSPSVQFSLPPSHRSASPSQPPMGLTRGSPLHLSHHSSSSALSAAAAAAAERDRQAALRQQSPHMTPPPTSSSGMISSPLNKMYGQQSTPSQQTGSISQQQTSQQRSGPPSSPPSHLRPGTSPPVVRHPHIPFPLPFGQPSGMPTQIGMHPHNPYSHNLNLIHPMFYPHQHNPFTSPYPYHPYGPAGFQYMKPPTGAGIEPSVIPHHPGPVPSRCEEPPQHADKQLSSSQNMQHKVRINPLLAIRSISNKFRDTLVLE